MKTFRRDRNYKGNLLELPNPKIINLKEYNHIKFKENSEKFNSNDYADPEIRQKAIDKHKKLHFQANQIIKGLNSPFSLRLLDNFEVFNYHNFLYSLQERTIESTTFALFSEIREIQDRFLKHIYMEDLKDLIKKVDLEEWGKIFLNKYFNLNFSISTKLGIRILKQTKEFIKMYFKKENKNEIKEEIEINKTRSEELRYDYTEIQNLNLIEERERIFKLLPKSIKLNDFLISENNYERIKKDESIYNL